MEPNQDRSLVPRPSHELTTSQTVPSRILGEMVENTLALAKEVAVAGCQRSEVALPRVMLARDYFTQHYAADFAVFRSKALCGKTLSKVMSEPKRSAFRGFAEFVLCQFALNLHNQEFYDHFPQLHFAWREYSAPFGDVRLCQWGHGLGGRDPDLILRFVQSPPQGFRLPRVRYEWAIVTDFIRFLFGDYLAGFARSLVESEFTPERYIAAIAADSDCRVTILTPNGWESRDVTSLLPTPASSN